jgi:hypothetical protein
MKQFLFLLFIVLSTLSASAQIPLPYIESFDSYTANQALNGDGGLAASTHVYVTPHGIVGNCAEFQMSDTATSLYDTITSPLIGPLTAHTVTSFYFRAVQFLSSIPTVYQMTGSDQAIIYVGNNGFTLAAAQYTIDSADQNITTGYVKVTVGAPVFVNGYSGRFRIITSNPDGHNWRLEFDSFVVRDTVSHLIPPTITSIITNIKCRAQSNGAIKVTASGNGPFTYLWSVGGQTTDSIGGLAAGAYTVTVTDSLGASATLTATVTQPALALLLDSLTKTEVSCYGGNNGLAIVYASGGTLPYVYLWSSNPPSHVAMGVDLYAQNYSVTVTDANGCEITATTHISQPSTSLITTTSSTQSTSGNNGTATVAASGGSGPYSYIWSTSPAQTTTIAIDLTPGDYEVTVTDAAGCSLTDTVFVSFPDGINELTDQQFYIYPNPASDQVYINISNANRMSLNVSIIDLSGRVVLQETISSATINTSSLANGIYLLKLNTSKAIYICRFVIQHYTATSPAMAGYGS